MRKLIGIVLAVILAAVGTVGLVAYVSSAERRALAGERTVDVFVVAETIPKGTPAEELRGRVRSEQIPAKVQAEGVVTSLETLEGRVAAVDLLAGEQLVSSRFVVPTQLGAITVPDGLQEVTVALPPERAVGGALQPGDTAAVTASFSNDGSDGSLQSQSHMILHKVLVTRVQVAAQPQIGPQQRDGEAGAPQGNILVTLALPAASVERVVFTAEHGTLWLSREPEDTPEGRTTIRTPENIYQ